MNTILSSVVPFFAVIACGFAAARFKVISEEGIGGLNAFVYYVALPALLYRVTATHALAEIVDLRFLGAYALSSASLYIGGALFARIVLRAPLVDSAFIGLGASMANIAYLAIPLVVTLLGEDGAVPLVLCIVADQTLTVPLTIAIADATKGSDRTPRAIIRDILQSLYRNPLLLGIAAGIAASAAGAPLAGPLDSFVRLLGAAVAPCALFAVGATLVERPSPATLASAAAVSTAKLFIHPLLFWAAALLFGVSPFAVMVGILGAAMPVSKTVFILAHRFRVQVAGTAAAIVVSTAVSLITISALAAWVASR